MASTAKAGRTTDAAAQTGASGGERPARPQPPEGENRNFNLEIYPLPLAEALDANRDLLAARAIQEGRSAEDAHSDLSFLLEILKSVQTVTLREHVKPGAYEVRLQGAWK